MASALDKYPQIGFADSGYQPIPKKNKKYSYFDDGKIKPSRHSFMKILDVIPFEEASLEMIEFWEAMKSASDWIFAKETDYFIIGYEMPDDSNYQTIHTTLFARHDDRGWYGFRTDDPDGYWHGQLVTNPYFDYNEFVEELKK